MQNYKKQFRHELKYLIDDRELLLLESKLKNIIRTDLHNVNGAYRIRSVYFDDYGDSALKKNLNGTSPRSKYRIRIYNENTDGIYLEQKIKNHDMTLKNNCSITRQECEELMSGRIIGMGQEKDRELLVRFKAGMCISRLEPKVIVEYERKAYICKEGNVRITFDRNLSSSGYFNRFLVKDMLKRPVMPPGKHVLEVKYDEFLPRYIKDVLNTGKMERTTYSKYVLCRELTIR